MLLLKLTDHNNYAFLVLIIMNFAVLPPGDSRFEPKALCLSVSILLLTYTLSSQCGWGSPESTIYGIPQKTASRSSENCGLRKEEILSGFVEKNKMRARLCLTPNWST